MLELLVYHQNKRVKIQPLNSGVFILGSGRSLTTDVTLQYPTVSKQHAEIQIHCEQAENQVSIRDLGSRNGTFKSGEPVERDTWQNWEQNDTIEIGPFRLSWQKATTITQSESDILQALAKGYSKLLGSDPKNAREKIVAEICDSGTHAPEARDSLISKLLNEFHGDGPLEVFLKNKNCREIIINAFNEIFVDIGLGLEKAENHFISRETYEAWASRTANQAGRRLDLQHPICEATLSDGARFHGVLSPISARGVSIAIRRFGSAPLDEETALESKWIDATALSLLKSALIEKKNIVISGGTSTGKTSLLNFLCQYLNKSERVLTVEDTVELSPPVENLVQLQARTPNADGIGQVALRQLVQCALRMRPDRIIVGECRGAEVLDMLQALNTGHPGSLTTVHANSPTEALQRLELLALLGAPNLTVQSIREWIHSTVDLIIQVERDATGHRHISEISERQEDKRYAAVYKR